jgi:hypothetical protein
MGNKWLYLRFLERKRIMELAFMNKMATILQKGYRCAFLSLVSCQIDRDGF